MTRKRGSNTIGENESKLYEEIGRLKVELDWLKKNQGYDVSDRRQNFKCLLTYRFLVLQKCKQFIIFIYSQSVQI